MRLVSTDIILFSPVIEFFVSLSLFDKLGASGS